ncbi:MAG: hypothetical protein HZB39_07885 [Planctomycetes bacterium]|nr:hypothetical protein [Planctomycetota bacterium]
MNPRLRLLSASLGLASLLAAQEHASDAALARALAARPRVIPVHAANSDSGVEYGLWAAGESYKVAFSGDMTFVPYLGAAYPQNLPWSFRTESVRVGSRELLVMGREPSQAREATRVEYRHGPITEAYDVLSEGLEQTFVLPVAPGVPGDLVVTGRVTTLLRCAKRGDAHAALEFSDKAGARILSYGAATVVDAAGRRSPITTGWDGAHELRLTVPGDWLAAATYPVTIDPLLGTISVSSPSARCFSADVARDDAHDQFVWAFVLEASAADRDVIAYTIPSDFTTTRLVFDDLNTWDSPQVQVAVAGSPSTHLIAFNRVINDVSGVRFHRRIGASTAYSTQVTIQNAPSGAHDWRVDVGGQRPYPAPGNDDTFLLVWQRDYAGLTFANTNTSSIWGRTIGTNGSASVEFVLAIGITVSRDFELPSVNQEARWVPGGTEWLVAYQRFNNNFSPAVWTVEGRLVDDATNVAANTWSATRNGSASHRVAPQVAGSIGRYLVAFNDIAYSFAPVKTGITSGTSLKTERVDWSSSGAPTNHDETTLFGAYAEPRMLLGGIAYDYVSRSHWCVVSASSRNLGGAGRSIVNRVGFNGATTETATLESPAASQQCEVGACCFDDDLLEFACTWSINTSMAGRVGLRRLYYQAPGALRHFGNSCTSASIGWSGAQQIGGAFDACTLRSAPANTLAILVLGYAAQNPPLDLTFIGMPSCWLNVPSAGAGNLGTIGTSSDSGGGAGVTLPLPENLSPFELSLQWIVATPGANALGLVTTQGLAVPLVR